MKLSDAFEYFDRRNDGVITFEEVSEMIINLYILSILSIIAIISIITEDYHNDD